MLADFYLRCSVRGRIGTEERFQEFLRDIRDVFTTVEVYSYGEVFFSEKSMIILCQGRCGVGYFTVEERTVERGFYEVFTAVYYEERQEVQLMHGIGSYPYSENVETKEKVVRASREELLEKLLNFIREETEEPLVLDSVPTPTESIDVEVREECGSNIVRLVHEVRTRCTEYSISGVLCLLLSGKEPVDHQKLIRILEKYEIVVRPELLRSM